MHYKPASSVPLFPGHLFPTLHLPFDLFLLHVLVLTLLLFTEDTPCSSLPNADPPPSDSPHAPPALPGPGAVPPPAGGLSRAALEAAPGPGPCPRGGAGAGAAGGEGAG